MDVMLFRSLARDFRVLSGLQLSTCRALRYLPDKKREFAVVSRLPCRAEIISQ